MTVFNSDEHVKKVPQPSQPASHWVSHWVPAEPQKAKIWCILNELLSGLSPFPAFRRNNRSTSAEYADGKVEEFFAMSKGYMEMNIKPPGETEKSAALAVTHIVTDWPMETHVLVSLMRKVPVVVRTKRGLWKVDGANITFIRVEE